MKQKITKANGYKTLDMKVEDLRRHSKLISIKQDPFNGAVIKYFDLKETLDLDIIVEVTEMAGKVVSVRNLKDREAVLKTIPPINPPMFGGF